MIAAADTVAGMAEVIEAVMEGMRSTRVVIGAETVRTSMGGARFNGSNAWGSQLQFGIAAVIDWVERNPTSQWK